MRSAQIIDFYGGRPVMLPSMTRCDRAKELTNDLAAFAHSSNRENHWFTMENEHRYVQWYFPTSRPSRHVTESVFIDTVLQDFQRTFVPFLDLYTCNVHHMFEFWGLTVDESGVVRVANQRRLDNFVQNTHNVLRLTRLLHSVQDVAAGCHLLHQTVAIAVFLCTRCSPRSVSYWFHAASRHRARDCIAWTETYEPLIGVLRDGPVALPIADRDARYPVLIMCIGIILAVMLVGALHHASTRRRDDRAQY